MNSNSQVHHLKTRFAAPKSRDDAYILFQDALASMALDHCDYDELRAGTTRIKKEQQCFRTLLCLLPTSLRTALAHDRKATVDINLAARGGFPAITPGTRNLWLRAQRDPDGTWAERGGNSPCSGPVAALLAWYVQHTGLAARVIADPSPALSGAAFHPAKIDIEVFILRFRDTCLKLSTYHEDNALPATPEHILAGYLQEAFGRYKDKAGKQPFRDAFNGLRFDFMDPGAAQARLRSLDSVADIARKVYARLAAEGSLPKPPSKPPAPDTLSFVSAAAPPADTPSRQSKALEEKLSAALAPTVGKLSAVLAALTKLTPQGGGAPTQEPKKQFFLPFCRNCGDPRSKCPKGPEECVVKSCGRCGAAGCNITRCPVKKDAVTCAFCQKPGHIAAACSSKKKQAATAPTTE